MESEGSVPESRDDEFEEGEIKEAFRAEEYDGIYLELGLLLSCEMRDRDASAKAQKVRHLYVVRDDHLFIKRQVGNPKRIVYGRNRQIDIIAALHDGIAGGHKGIGAMGAKISELYHWDRKLTMVIKYCQSCVPCQERSAQRSGEPLHPRLEREVGAVVHLDLLFMLVGKNGYNYIFDARDNLTGFVDGRAIRTKTGPVLANCIEEYYLCYLFVKEFVMDRGSEFTCNEVRTLLAGYGVVTNYTMAVHPQANAPMERGHSTITNLLAKWTEGKPGQWPKFLREAFFVENVTDVEARMQRLRASPLGRDGFPIRLEEGNAEEFIPAYEQYMRDQGTGQQEWMQTFAPLDTEGGESHHQSCHPQRGGVDAGVPLRGAHETRVERPSKETAEEKRARVRVRLEEIYQEKVRMEAAGEVPRPPVTPRRPSRGSMRLGPVMRGKEVQGLFGQGGMAGPSQREGMKKVYLDPAEVEARRETRERDFSFKAPTELASQQVTSMAVETITEEPAQRPQPPLVEGEPVEESPRILLEVQGGTVTGAGTSTKPEATEEEASRLDELVAAMELDMPSGGPQRHETPERVQRSGS
ncbi:hypothetical protein CBR_g50147 [Chara braunii]|uniref:Integrase catalytic domain-containing protein n=1 Tax=Chara braunii TaxID=69332 RepID=A0A388M641_CHABU|nr:hypothetical protein CBR_g50147 [Chara braunii]|eukprot:GBG90054.1 hypothetical protein CBR_g50147 [Chara braunii]